MNTKNSNTRKQTQSVRQQQGPKKQGQSNGIHQEHELPEARLTR